MDHVESQQVESQYHLALKWLVAWFSQSCSVPGAGAGTRCVRMSVADPFLAAVCAASGTDE